MVIKAVLFDMDGVLIDAKDWHYEALNKALGHFGLEISRDEHLAIYDGLPTRRKLEMLSRSRGLPVRLHAFINELKQEYTAAITVDRCRPMFHHQYALAGLKRAGYTIGVCSNSIRRTVALMMDLSRLSPHLDFCLSNEDVQRPKPDPEIYTLGIQRAHATPQETLIVEDNDHGIAAARASGAHVMVVGSVYDVTQERIAEEIARAEGRA
jgi:HAD superfamily hydrolase (TIGR01509 family)